MDQQKRKFEEDIITHVSRLSTNFKEILESLTVII